MYTGQCLCGGVRFAIDGKLAPIQICYCKQCQRAQGTVFATNIPVSAAAFKLIQGGDLLRNYESSPGKQRCFCSRCGSPVYSKKDSLPDVLRIRAGIIDDELDTQVSVHCYTAAKPNWWEIRDNLPQYPEAYVPQ